MKVTLGIDTGGTYTDAVLVDDEGAVVASAKALTTHHALAIGIDEAIDRVFKETAVRPDNVSMVGLSTTLATNAMVEGQGRPICLLLIGYDQAMVEKFGFARDFVTQDVVYLAGGHDSEGNAVAPLDEAGARAAILTRRERVEAFAVSGYFSVRNPAHELRVKALVEELTGDGPEALPLPVTCGHQLSTRLNAIRRATTVALNARLIPLLRDLIVTVRRALDARHIHAPLMIVKGDGSLVRSDWAIRRPIETILSGPAASVVGAWHLAGKRDVWVVDVGGTTTDIAVLRDGLPQLNPEGAQVGGWRTLVEAADVHTVGLGGDSHIRLGDDGGLQIGPQRVLPLCRLAAEHPEIRTMLRAQALLTKRWQVPLLAQFLLARRELGAGMTSRAREIRDMLTDAPGALVEIVKALGPAGFIMRDIEQFVANQVVQRAAFTPTDALHVLGRFQLWDVEAARLGATLLAAQVGLTPEAFCEQVVARVSTRVAEELVTKVMTDEIGAPDWAQEPTALGLLARAMGAAQNSDLGCQFTLRQPLVAVGAPVAAYLPRTASHLRTPLIIPQHADVANAVGAVAGGVVQRLQILIRPVDFESSYRVYSTNGLYVGEKVRDFDSLEAAVDHAMHVVPEHLTALAQRAGAAQVEIQMSRDDRSTPVRDRPESRVFLETVLTFTAVGRGDWWT